MSAIRPCLLTGARWTSYRYTSIPLSSVPFLLSVVYLGLSTHDLHL